MFVVEGKYWAAIKDNQVIGTISMLVPEYVDFDQYVVKARECLALLGEVKAGEVVLRGGKPVFKQRLTHRNRRKSTDAAVPMEYAFRMIAGQSVRSVESEEEQ
ncbi:MAG: hypothetical protein M3Q07_00845 [Pseudobdellovibrionaceae bacterium]|nr:hypothetical protein [Pseudobdellovibrionaceae bacterium]